MTTAMATAETTTTAFMPPRTPTAHERYRDRLVRAISGQLAAAGMEDPATARAFTFGWKVGVELLPWLDELRDAEGRPVYDGRANPTRLCGLDVSVVGGVDSDVVLLLKMPRVRPSVVLPLDHIGDAAAALRSAFRGGRLAELMRALAADAT